MLERIDTSFGTFEIVNGTYKGEEARLYEVDGTRESATFFDARKNDPVFDYIKTFADVLKRSPEAERVLMLGGAGFQFPKYFISHYPDKTLDVVEMNPLAVKLARKYFYLNDLENEYQAESSGRLNIIIREGMEFFRETNEKYDMIINDAYHSNIPDSGLISNEGTVLIGDHLNPGGKYVLNLISSLKGIDSMPFHQVKAILSYHFSEVNYIKSTPGALPERSQNIVFLCS